MPIQKPLRIKKSTLMRSIWLVAICGLVASTGLVSFILLRHLTLNSGDLASLAPIFGKGREIQRDQSGNVLPEGEGSGNLNSSDPIVNLTPWDGASRVTILLLGLDYRDWEASEKFSRSDTMILLTLDPLNKTAGMLSIPRDMWVSIPGFKNGKINTAYYLGDAYQLPGGGPGLAVKTVEQFLGVPINYYAQIDFGAFVRFIDELGGVKINVPEKITVDLLGAGAKTKKALQAGVQVLPGEWALAYARARNTEGGDFDRANRQQQVILGLRDRILSLNMLPTLIAKAPVLYEELSSGIHTNLSLDEAIKLALLVKDIGRENIQQGVFDEQYTIFGRSPDNLSILIPIPDKIHLLRDKIFAASSSLSPATPGDALAQMQSEGAKIFIYNASQSPELANSTADYLRNKGANVVQAGESAETYAATLIIDHSGKPYALKYLGALMNVSPMNILSRQDPSSPSDIEIYLGRDWAVNNPMQ